MGGALQIVPAAAVGVAVAVAARAFDPIGVAMGNGGGSDARRGLAGADTGAGARA